MNKILDDIKPLTSSRRPATKVKVYEPKVKAERVKISEDRMPPEQPERSLRVLWIIAVVAVVGLFVALSGVFGSATVTLSPKTAKADTANTVLSAKKNATEGELAFEFMSLTEESSTSVEGTGGENSERKATGTVILYNEYSTESQPLLVNTRLETKDGKLFRTDSAVTIPGYTKTGTTVNPGFVSVKVHADVAGPEYNIQPSDFVIVGFKDTPRGAKIYGRAKTAMTGGFKGVLYEVSATDKEKALTSLDTSLRQKLKDRATKELPEGYAAFADSYVWSLEPPSSLEGSTAKMDVTQKGTLIVPIFKREVLVGTLAKTAITGYKDEPVDSDNLDTLKFSYKDAAFDPRTATVLEFTLSGAANFIYSVDTETLQVDLAGLSRKDFQETMAAHDEVESASVVLRPLWKRTFPKNPEKINIVVETEAPVAE